MATQDARANVLVSIPRMSITIGVALALGIVVATLLYVAVSDEYRGALIFSAPVSPPRRSWLPLCIRREFFNSP